MKKILISLFLAVICVMSAACAKKVDINTLANSFTAVASATKATHEVKVYAGEEKDALLLSEQKKTFSVSGNSVTLQMKSSKLNEDYADIFSNEEKFIVEEKSEKITLDSMKKQLPTKVALNESSVKGDLHFIKDGSKITFDIDVQPTAVAALLALSAADANTISELTLQAVTVNEKLTSCEMNYKTKDGNFVVIIYQITY